VCVFNVQEYLSTIRSMVGQRVYSVKADTAIVEVRATLHSYTGSACVVCRVRNKLSSESAAFNFVHFLAHLVADGVCFTQAFIHFSQNSFNPAIYALLREWCGGGGK
jgi:hypothetical protein